jgi:hypothetical protein
VALQITNIEDLTIRKQLIELVPIRRKRCTKIEHRSEMRLNIADPFANRNAASQL